MIGIEEGYIVPLSVYESFKGWLAPFLPGKRCARARKKKDAPLVSQPDGLYIKLILSNPLSNLPAPTPTPRNRTLLVPREPLLRMPRMHRMPATPADADEILHQLPPSPFPLVLALPLSSSSSRRSQRAGLRPALGMRVRHAEPEHADGAAGHMLAALGAHGARLLVREDGARGRRRRRGG